MPSLGWPRKKAKGNRESSFFFWMRALLPTSLSLLFPHLDLSRFSISISTDHPLPSLEQTLPPSLPSRDQTKHTSTVLQVRNNIFYALFSSLLHRSYLHAPAALMPKSLSPIGSKQAQLSDEQTFWFVSCCSSPRLVLPSGSGRREEKG